MIIYCIKNKINNIENARKGLLAYYANKKLNISK